MHFTGCSFFPYSTHGIELIGLFLPTIYEWKSHKNFMLLHNVSFLCLPTNAFLREEKKFVAGFAFCSSCISFSSIFLFFSPTIPDKDLFVVLTLMSISFWSPDQRNLQFFSWLHKIYSVRDRKCRVNLDAYNFWYTEPNALYFFKKKPYCLGFWNDYSQKSVTLKLKKL